MAKKPVDIRRRFAEFAAKWLDSSLDVADADEVDPALKGRKTAGRHAGGGHALAANPGDRGRHECVAHLPQMAMVHEKRCIESGGSKSIVGATPAGRSVLAEAQDLLRRLRSEDPRDLLSS